MLEPMRVLVKNPKPRRRRSYRDNPVVSQISREVEEDFLQGVDLMDIGVAMVGLLGTQKLVEPIVKLVSPPAPVIGKGAGGPSNAWWVEPVASVLAAAAAGYGGAALINKRVGKYLAIGGGITAGLNIVKRIPILQGLVAPGETMIGGPASVPPMRLSPPMPMMLPAPMPAAKPVADPVPFGRSKVPNLYPSVTPAVPVHKL